MGKGSKDSKVIQTKQAAFKCIHMCVYIYLQHKCVRARSILLYTSTLLLYILKTHLPKAEEDHGFDG